MEGELIHIKFLPIFGFVLNKKFPIYMKFSNFLFIYLNILGAKGKYNKIISNVQHIKHIIKVLDYENN